MVNIWKQSLRGKRFSFFLGRSRSRPRRRHSRIYHGKTSAIECLENRTMLAATMLAFAQQPSTEQPARDWPTSRSTLKTRLALS